FRAFVNRHPFLIPALGQAHELPACTAVGRAPQIAMIHNIDEHSEVIKYSICVRGQDRVASKSTWLKHAREFPTQAAVGGIGPSRLAKIIRYMIKLPPADRDSIWVCRINAQ